MTRSQLACLSRTHALALTAIVAPETGTPPPMAAALALREAARHDLPELVETCTRFVEALRDSHGRLPDVAVAGRQLRTAVLGALAFVPHDLHRVDIHG